MQILTVTAAALAIAKTLQAAWAQVPGSWQEAFTRATAPDAALAALFKGMLEHPDQGLLAPAFSLDKTGAILAFEAQAEGITLRVERITLRSSFSTPENNIEISAFVPEHASLCLALHEGRLFEFLDLNPARRGEPDWQAAMGLLLEVMAHLGLTRHMEGWRPLFESDGRDYRLSLGLLRPTPVPA